MYDPRRAASLSLVIHAQVTLPHDSCGGDTVETDYYDRLGNAAD